MTRINGITGGLVKAFQQGESNRQIAISGSTVVTSVVPKITWH